jgi:hypothetical protein
MATATTIRTAFDRSFSSNAAANYERYFVPVIGGPFGADLVEGGRSPDG